MFFLLSKLVGLLIRAETFVVLLLVLSLMATRWQRLRMGQGALRLALVLLVGLTLFPFGSLLLRPLEMRFVADPPLAGVDGIILLGGSEDALLARYWGQPALNGGAERYTATAALARRFPEALVLFSGGSGRVTDQTTKEAASAADMLISLGVDATRLRLENQSRNTAENARNSLALVHPKPQEVWVLVTSAAHMPRAIGSFCKAGWAVIPYPVDYRSAGFWDQIVWDLPGNLGRFNQAVKEWIGLVSYYASGRMSAIFPQGC